MFWYASHLPRSSRDIVLLYDLGCLSDLEPISRADPIGGPDLISDVAIISGLVPDSDLELFTLHPDVSCDGGVTFGLNLTSVVDVISDIRLDFKFDLLTRLVPLRDSALVSISELEVAASFWASTFLPAAAVPAAAVPAAATPAAAAPAASRSPASAIARASAVARRAAAAAATAACAAEPAASSAARARATASAAAASAHESKKDRSGVRPNRANLMPAYKCSHSFLVTFILSTNSGQHSTCIHS